MKKPNPIIELAARRDEANVNRSMWISHLQANANGGFRGNVFNVMKGLELAPELAGVATYDEFSRKLIVAKPPPWDSGTQSRRWSDDDDVHLQRWFQAHGVPVQSVKTVCEAVRATAARFDALRDYVSGLKWDNKKRVGTWLSTYLGAEDNPYTRDVGQKWLVSAIARALRPACQVDHLLVLEGAQGLGKTSAVRILGGEWTKENLSDLHTKDSVVELQGNWIVELSELSAIARSEVEVVKAFISRTVDKYREPYGRHSTEQLRRCVFIGTTNDDRYLKDSTGNRRFWPVKVARVAFEELSRDRDQLWAEAAKLYKSGAKWHITNKRAARMAEVEQAKRFEDDPWTPAVLAGLDSRDSVTTRQLLAKLDIEPSRQNGGHAKRIGGIMRRSGWSSHVDKSGGERDVVWTHSDAKTRERKHAKT